MEIPIIYTNLELMEILEKEKGIIGVRECSNLSKRERLESDLAGLRESKTVFMCGNMSLFKHLTPWSITISGINNITLRIQSN